MVGIGVIELIIALVAILLIATFVFVVMVVNRHKR